MKKILVTFHYYELNRHYKENLMFFLLYAWRPELDFLVLISGDCSVPLIKKSNIEYAHVPNMNHDFGAYSYAVQNQIKPFHSYDRLIFINSLVRGPFHSGNHSILWYERLLSLIDDEHPLVGSTINILSKEHEFSIAFRSLFPKYNMPYTHVQTTTAYTMTKEAFEILVEEGFYELDYKLEKYEVILHYELLLSQIFIFMDSSH